MPKKLSAVYPLEF